MRDNDVNFYYKYIVIITNKCNNVKIYVCKFVLIKKK